MARFSQPIFYKSLFGIVGLVEVLFDKVSAPLGMVDFLIF